MKVLNMRTLCHPHSYQACASTNKNRAMCWVILPEIRLIILSLPCGPQTSISPLPCFLDLCNSGQSLCVLMASVHITSLRKLSQPPMQFPSRWLHHLPFICIRFTALKACLFWGSKQIKSANQGWSKREATRSFLLQTFICFHWPETKRCQLLCFLFGTLSFTAYSAVCLGQFIKNFINIFLFLIIFIVVLKY